MTMAMMTLFNEEPRTAIIASTTRCTMRSTACHVTGSLICG
jgi:hypothetical protein